VTIAQTSGVAFGLPLTTVIPGGCDSATFVLTIGDVGVIEPFHAITATVIAVARGFDHACACFDIVPSGEVRRDLVDRRPK